MKRSLIVASLMLATFAAYGQQPQRPSDDELNARIQALSAQRNEAQDKYVILAGAAEAQVRKMQAEIDQLKVDYGLLKKVTPGKDAKVLTVPVPMKEMEAVCFATDPVQCFAPKKDDKK